MYVCVCVVCVEWTWNRLKFIYWNVCANEMKSHREAHKPSLCCADESPSLRLRRRYYYSHILVVYVPLRNDNIYVGNNDALFNVICTFLTLWLSMFAFALFYTIWCIYRDMSRSHIWQQSLVLWSSMNEHTHTHPYSLRAHRMVVEYMCFVLIRMYIPICESSEGGRVAQKGCETWKAQYCGLIKLHMYV